MSSVQKTQTGYRIQFRANGKSLTISLGDVRKTAAVEFQLHLNRLIQVARGIGSLTPLDLQWIAELSPEIRKRLIECGLIESAKEPFRKFFKKTLSRLSRSDSLQTRSN